jgi:NAD(P)H dehydrogenase (quinone)
MEHGIKDPDVVNVLVLERVDRTKNMARYDVLSVEPTLFAESSLLHVKLNRAPIAGYADRLLAAEALILIYPVWNEGFPAILKGFFDRVFIPGVSFTVGPDGALVTNLQKLRKVAAVCTYGASRTITFLLGDPPKRVVKRMVRWMPGHSVRCDYLAYYDMDHSSENQRAAFLKKVRRTFAAW